jgi:hypothetical protein
MTEKPEAENVNVRLPAELRAVLERQAAAEHRTLSQQIRFLIACGIEARAQPRHAGGYK